MSAATGRRRREASYSDSEVGESVTKTTGSNNGDDGGHDEVKKQKQLQRR